MNQYCVSYDLLNKTSSDYSKIYRKFQAYESYRLQQSMWVVKTAKSIDDVQQDFRHCVGQDDRLMVIPLSDDLLNVLKE